jgi:hypothetical protein
MDYLENKKVVTRKPHYCWGCAEFFDIGSSMQFVKSVDGGSIHRTYWCDTCLKKLDELEDFQIEDGFAYGELKEYFAEARP